MKHNLSTIYYMLNAKCIFKNANNYKCLVLNIIYVFCISYD